MKNPVGHPSRYALSAITERSWLVVPWSEQRFLIRAVEFHRRTHRHRDLVITPLWLAKPVALKVSLAKPVQQ